MIDLGELKVPKALRPIVEEIVGITDAVCLAVLDEEYADLARRVTAKLARKRPSPLVGGRRNTWAAGIVYVLGQDNFLSDPANEPCVTADQLSEAFGVAKSTMGSKAKQVRDLLRISPFSLEFQRADVAERNPLVWFIEVNGVVVDARSAPLAIQMEAHRRKLIPYVPAFGPNGNASLEDSAVGLLERAILQHPLADGRTVVEIFAAEHPELTEADRRVLLGWREVVEGIFETRERAGEAIVAMNLAELRLAAEWATRP